MEEAIDAYEKILKQDAGNRYAMKRLKEFRSTLEGVKKAAKAKEERQTLKRKLEKEYAVGMPESVQGMLSLASGFRDVGDYEKAVLLFGNVLKKILITQQPAVSWKILAAEWFSPAGPPLTKPGPPCRKLWMARLTIPSCLFLFLFLLL